MKALKYIIFLLLILIIGAAIYVAVQPNEFTVTRTKTINAPSQLVFNNIIDFKNWEAWSSWAEADPDMTITLPEQTSGVGGSYQWEDKDGIGTMKTIEVIPFTEIKQQMQFADFPPSDISWKIIPTEDGKTEVTWNIAGKDLPFGFKAFSAFMGGMEKQIGPHFERGLVKLDSVLIDDMKKYEVTVNGISEYGGGFYLYKTTNATNSNISQKMGEQYGSIMAYIMQNKIDPNGMPLTVYQEMNNEEGTVIMSNGIPVKERIDVAADSDILCGYIPKMRTLKTTLLGNYSNLEKAWSQAMTHMSENNLIASEHKPFEIYTNDPGQVPNPSEWRTEIYIPLKEE
jgi:effector-binding domain-containing protein